MLVDVLSHLGSTAYRTNIGWIRLRTRKHIQNRELMLEGFIPYLTAARRHAGGAAIASRPAATSVLTTTAWIVHFIDATSKISCQAP